MNRIIFSVISIIAAVSCNELSILKSPKSIDFKGTSKVPSDSLANIFSASLGYSVDRLCTDWDGFIVNDPFNLATGVMVMVIEGNAKSPVEDVKTYELEGSSIFDSLNDFLLEVFQHKKTGFHMDLKQPIPFVTPLGELKLRNASDSKVQTEYLKPKSIKEDHKILDQISYINEISEVLSTLPKENLPTASIINVSLRSLTKVHTLKSPAFIEAKKLLSNAIENLATSADKAFDGQSLFAVIATDMKIRPQQIPNDLNLADNDCDEIYPGMCLIILWFSVTMIYLLCAIAYAIGYMDPGKDFMIYRLIPTKKDN